MSIKIRFRYSLYPELRQDDTKKVQTAVNATVIYILLIIFEYY